MMARWLLIVGVLSAAGPVWAEQDVAALKARIAELEKENAALRRELAELRGDLQTVTAEKQELATRQTEAVEQRRAMYLVSQYEPSAGKTTMVSKPVRLDVTHGSRADHHVQLTAEGQGRGDRNPTVTMTISAYVSGRSYHVADQLELTIDGQARTFPVAGYERDKKMTGSSKNRTDRSDEYLTFRLTADDVRAIGKAANVTGRAGTVRYEFSTDLIRLFGAAAESIDSR